MLRLPGMRLSLPKEIIAIVAAMNQAGYEIFLVGGSVRDLVLNRPVHDWDFTTSALPDQIKAVFPEAFYENIFGTVSVVSEHLYEQLGLPANTTIPETKEQTQVYEITTFRSDGTYSDHRRPDQVTWGKSIQDDLERRDFTINAMAIKLTTDQAQQAAILNDFLKAPDSIDLTADLIDPFQGRLHLEQGIIKAVGDPDKRFEEDALRMLRAIRLASQLKFAIDPETLIAIQAKSAQIQHVSWERIRDELLKILVTDQVEDALSIMATTGLLNHIMPELIATKGVEQRGHHEYDVWHHLFKAVQLCPSKDPVVRLATLLHDIAKPQTQAPLADKPGEYSFHNHEVVGARVARDIARRLRLPKDDIQRIFTLVRWHMFYYQPTMTDAAIRRFMRRVGPENMEDIMALREADRLGSGSKRTSWRLEEMKQRIQDQLHQPMKVSDLVINGNDVMETLNIPAGPRIGMILNELFEEVLDEPEKNTRDYLLNRLKQLPLVSQSE